MSSKAINNLNGGDNFNETSHKHEKNINGNLKESRCLLKEYKENLLKFDNNINEIKNALSMLKLSLGNYKV